ncbi:MAG TPA: glutamate 5-kinase [Gammaproteobacteria bacterium]|nr:glutamate 5-kinase [Gammaproteobacteria bacterium]
MKTREQLSACRRWVIKIGSALATHEGRGLRAESIDAWVAQAAALLREGHEVVLVTSGSVAEGVARLGWKQRPHALHELQAAAAVGQMGLVQAYESGFKRHGIRTAQVLLTHEDLANRQRYLNACSTLRTLLKLQVVPVINENDTVATEEIKLGDNDTLAALVANLIEADVLVILTDIAGLYDRDPRRHPDARLIPEARAGDPALEPMAGEGGQWGRGGMRTKVRAAKLAARSGAATVIASGQEVDVLKRLAAGEALGTLLTPTEAPLAARKQWLGSGLKVQGKLILDAGAVRVLREQGRSLLAVGVKDVDGDFARGALVACLDTGGREIARGLTNYSAVEARAIKGLASDRIESVLGYAFEPELIHRDNLVLT